MFTITQHPYVATTIARQQVDERIRDAAARRAVRMARAVHTDPADVRPPPPRRWWWKYAGAGLAGIATSCVLAAPALAMRPDPTPAGEQQQRIYESDIIANAASTKDPAGPAASPGNAGLADHWDGHTGSPATATGTNPTAGGVDWSNLATALGGGVVLTGAIAVGATQLHRRQTHPA